MIFRLRLRGMKVETGSELGSVGDVSVEVARKKDLNIFVILFGRDNEVMKYAIKLLLTTFLIGVVVDENHLLG